MPPMTTMDLLVNAAAGMCDAKLGEFRGQFQLSVSGNGKDVAWHCRNDVSKLEAMLPCNLIAQ